MHFLWPLISLNNQEKQQKREELNRLRNLKKQEIEDKLAQIQRKSGAESMPFTGEELDEEFDPDEHDKKMKVSFLTWYSVGLWCIFCCDLETFSTNEPVFICWLNSENVSTVTSQNKDIFPHAYLHNREAFLKIIHILVQICFLFNQPLMADL